MASQNRKTPYSLIQPIREEPYCFDLFHAMRLVECAYADKPRLGRSARASDDPVRVGQTPSLDFAPATISAFEPGKVAFRLQQRAVGLFGPNGVLPSHLTEYAMERKIHHHDETFARFVDVFHHRMLCLLYRAWADVQPTVHYDRPDSDRFGKYVASLFGIGVDSLRHRDPMPDRAKLYFAGLFACQTKHPDALTAIVADFFRLDVGVEEYIGEWMKISVTEQSRLGVSPRIASLGESAVLGERVWGCQHKFRLILGPMTLIQYLDLLPGRRALQELTAIVRNYIGNELVWDVNLVLKSEEIPFLQLNGTVQLGWTTWLGERKGRGDARDLRVNPLFVAVHSTSLP